MKTKLLPMMIGALLAGGVTAAAADVTLFGRVDVSIDYTDIDTASGSVDDGKDVNMNSNTSSFGIKGSEDLGNGLAAIFMADFQFDADERNAGDSKNSLTDRDQWIGLKGGFGTVVFGTKSTVYKSHGAKLDPLYKTSLQGRKRGLQSEYFHS
ncbi:MAG: porin, partial [Gammaproteobacteria bacterium]